MKKHLSLLIFLILGGMISAQNYEFSPLSRFGLGDLQRSRSPFSLHTGGAGAAYHHHDEFSFANPASLGFLKITDAELGFYAKNSRLEDKNGQQLNDWSGNLNYIHLAVPLFNSINQLLDRKEAKYPMGLSLGISPYSTTGYKYVIADSTGLTGRTTREQEGRGGLSRFSLGGAYRYKQLSMGLSVGYIFGNIEYSQIYRLRDIAGSASNFSENKIHASGFDFVLGSIYAHTLNKQKMKENKSIKAKVLSLGAHLTIPTKVGFTSDVLQYTRLNFASVIDTILYSQDVESSSKLPFKATVGLYYNDQEKRAYLLDINYELWENASLFEGSKGSLANFFSVNAGGSWRPSTTGYARLPNRSQYRYGFFYENGYLQSGGKSMQNYGISLGVGMPFTFQRQLAVINLGVEAGISELEGSVKSQYIKILAGVRLNDNEWFLKRRYN